MSGARAGRHTLQAFTLRSTSGFASPALLFTGEWDDEPEGLRIAAGQTISSRTYMNAFDAGTWQRLTGLDRFTVEITFRGAIAVTLVGMDPAGDEIEIGRSEAEAQTLDRLEIPFQPSARHPVVFARIVALSESWISKARIATAADRVNTVRLAVAITVFKREEALYAALENLSRASAAAASGTAPLYIVVDNGGTVEPSRLPRALEVRVVANPNAGGAGGFARGIIEAENADATHVIFMDDDASCEFESICRTVRLLEYSRYPNLAVAGAMLLENAPGLMHERGAHYRLGERFRIVSNSNGLDLTTPAGLSQAMRHVEIGYGGWWFFAFPILKHLRYPYPLFVRGDDWLFSYLNDFHITSLNGICSWQAGFSGKLSPSEQFLAYKAFLVADLVLGNVGLLGRKSFFRAWFRQNLFGFCYDRAEMQLAALRAVLQGPRFWADNVKLGGHLAKLRQAVSAERFGDPGAAERPGGDVARLRVSPMRIVKTHLLPASRLRAPVGPVDFQHGAAPDAAVLRAAVIYREPGGTRVFVARRDPARFFALWFASMLLFWRLGRHAPDLSAAYRNSVQAFCTRAWWAGKLGLPAAIRPEREHAGEDAGAIPPQ